MNNSYIEDFESLSGSLKFSHYHCGRRVYQGRDSAGQLWESRPDDADGAIYPIDDLPAHFRCEQQASFTPSTPSSAAMTHFPDTWDPPANYEVEDLPSSKRIAAKLGNYRRTMFGGARTSSSSSQRSETSARNVSVPEKRDSGVLLSVSSSPSSLRGSMGALSKRSSGWSAT